MNQEQPDLEKAILEAKLPVLAEFYADWCAPCQVLVPLVDQIGEAHKQQIEVLKINVDKNPTLASKYHIMSIPTLLFIKNGKVQEQLTGVPDEKEIKSKIERFIK